MRFRFILAEARNHAVWLMCKLLLVSRSGYYAWLQRREVASQRERSDRALLCRIKTLHQQSRGLYGAPRTYQALRQQGVRTSRKRVARLMREASLSARRPRRHRVTTDSKHGEQIDHNLLSRDFSASQPNRRWAADITYIAVNGQWAYLAVVMDVGSRRIIGWQLAPHMRTQLALDALKRAQITRAAKGGMHHSDRGVQYASAEYRSALAAAGITQSMSRKGNCWDNAVVESFFSTLKRELIRTRSWQTMKELRSAIADYIESFYNPVRLHSALGYRSPIQYELALKGSA